MSGFTFNPSGSSGTSTGSLFGTTGGGGGFLGQPSTTGGSLFGNTASTAPSGSSIFNSPQSGPPLFPQSTQSGQQKSMFGLSPSQTGTSKPEPPKPIFGQSQPPATPGAAPSLSAFPSISTTPAGPPPSLPGFAASTGAPSFNTGVGSTQNSFGQRPSAISSQPASTASASAGSSTPATSAPNLAPQPGAGSTQTSKPVFNFTTPSNTSTPSTGTQASTTAPNFSNLFSKPSTSVTSTGAPASTPATSFSNLFSSPPTSGPASTPFAGFPTASTQSTSSSTTATTAAAPKSFFAPSGGAGTASAAPKNPFGSAASAGASTSAAPTTNTAPASSTPLFAGFGPSTTTSSAKPSTTAPSFSFGPASSTLKAPTPTAAPSTSGPPTTSGPNPLNPAGPAPTNPNAPPATDTDKFKDSTKGPVPPAQSRLRNKTMDEILTRWATDLTRYSKEFKSHAETIAQWDQIIVDNSQKIDKLYVKTRTCEKQTLSVEMQLAAVENQQNELESWLAKYEDEVEDILAKDGANQPELGGPDQERERTYKLAERLGERLEGMGKDLESMVEEVNAANASLSKHTKSDEPITQIVRILNSHLTQLQVIDQGTAQLQTKVIAAQKAAHSMGYLNGAGNGDAKAAVDDFYRSYMGRR